MLLKLAWLNIWRNRRRTLITTASVFFAVLLAILFRSVTLGVYENMVQNIVSYSSGYLQVHKKGYWEEQSIDNSFLADENLSKTLIGHPNVINVMPRLENYALISFHEKTRGVLILGIDPIIEREVNHLNNKLLEGTYPENSNDRGIILGSGLAKLLNLKLHDTIVLIGQGFHATSAAGKFKVQGILRLGSPELNENVIYMPLSTAQELFNANNRLTSLSLILHKNSDLSGSKSSLENSINTNPYEVMTWKEMMPEMDQFIEADSAGHYIIIIILYLIISFGLFGTLLMMTFERRREFGILIAIGMKKHILATMVLLESIMISLIGCLLGITGGLALIYLFQEHPIQFGGALREVYEQYGFEPIIYFSGHPKIFITQTLIVLALASSLAIYPGLKLMRMHPVDAING